MAEYYQNIVEFLKNKDTEDTSHNLTLIENLSKEFSETWLEKVEKIK